MLDSQRRVLLFRHAGTDKPFWAPPGGGLLEGETYEQAAQREASEELGSVNVKLGSGWDSIAEFELAGVPVRQNEKYFVMQCKVDLTCDAVRAIHNREGILEHRWWSLPQLESHAETIFPEDLAIRIATLLRQRAS